VVRDDLGDGALGANTTGGHDQDPIGELLGLLQVVGGE